MNTWVVFVLTAFVVITVATGVFFFATTRGTLMWRGFASGGRDEKSHVYPLYSDMRLIKLVDQQPIISAILLFQYHCLVSKVIAEIGTIDLHGRKLLITSCAFGNVIPRVVKAAVEQGVERVLIADIIDNELIHARSKLGEFAQKVELVSADAAAMQQADGVVAANVIFFLLHELPHHLKGKALSEAARLVAPGGKLILAEFHRPQPAVLRALSWTYFKVFEPLGLALWDAHDPLKYLQAMGGFECERTTYFHGNFQVISATRVYRNLAAQAD